MPPLRATKTAATAAIAAGTTRTNTLGLGRAELEAVLNALDGQSEGATIRRIGTRMQYRATGVPVEIEQLGGGTTRIVVACRNLSAGGVGFLHSAYVHCGTRVTLHLHNLESGPAPIKGSVVRCRHLTRHIHEVGVKFDAPVDIYDYVEVDTLNQLCTMETVDASKLSGQLLVVAGYEMDRLLVRQYVSSTSMGVVTAGTIAEALALLSRPIDAILTDYELPDGTGVDLIAKMQLADSTSVAAGGGAGDVGARGGAGGGGGLAPTIVMSASPNTEIKRAVREAKAAGLLVKPFSQGLLLSALAEVLIGRAGAGAGASGGAGIGAGGGGGGGGVGPVLSSLPVDSPLRPLLPQFIDDLRKIADELPGLIQSDDVKSVRQRCEQIVSTAPALGLEPVGDAASRALRAVLAVGGGQEGGGAGSLTESQSELRDLASACKRVRSSKAA